MPVKPPHNYYVFSDGYYSTNNAVVGHGIQGGAHIVETQMSLAKRRILNATNIGWYCPFLFFIGAHQFGLYNQTGHYQFYISDASGFLLYQIYPNIMDFDKLTITIEGSTTSIFLDGQRVIYDTGGKTPDFTGLNLNVFLGAFLLPYICDICGCRWWNYPVGSLPAGWETEVKRRAMNPWQRSTVFGDANLRLEYLLDASVPDASLVVPNSINPGVGDLMITPAAQWQNARKLWKTRA